MPEKEEEEDVCYIYTQKHARDYKIKLFFFFLASRPCALVALSFSLLFFLALTSIEKSGSKGECVIKIKVDSD